MTVGTASITIGGQTVGPGERRDLWLDLGTRPDGSGQGIPVIVMQGAEPGPRLGITAGIHGDEYEGPEGLRRFLAAVDPAALRGTIIATPSANPLALEAFDRVGSVDHLDLNRSFPGKADAFITQRISHLLVTEIIAHADALIDLHSGGLAHDLVPYVGFNSTPGAVGEASFALARAIGIEYLYASTPFPNVLRLEAAKRHIPAILVEVGGEGRLNPDLIPVVERGLRNAAIHLGLLGGTPEAARNSFRIIKAPPSGEFMHAPSGGFLVSAVRVGAEVAQGQLLGTLVDPFGAELGRITSPVAGVVISYRTIPVMRTGDWSYSVLPVVARAGGDATLAEIAALVA